MNSPRVLSITRGLGWWADAFSLFRKSFLTWIGIFLLLMIILAVIRHIPILGSLILQILFSFLFYVFLAGMILGCRDQENGKPLRVNHLFAGFSSPQVGKLIGLGIISIIITIVLAFILGFLFVIIPGGSEIISDLVSGQSSFDEFMHSGDLQEIQPALQFFMIISLIGMALYLPVLMAYWFAPVLIILDELSIVEALKSSFLACLYNILPFTLYGLAGIVFVVIPAIPIGLVIYWGIQHPAGLADFGFMVIPAILFVFLGYIILLPVILLPVAFISIYKAYADIFHRQVQPAG